MRHRLLSQLILVLALGAVAAPLAHATGPYDGYKSSYPQLHQLRSGAAAGYDGYKSSYPQLQQVLSGAVSAPDITSYDGYKSSYPQLHALGTHRTATPTGIAVRGFGWRDAAIGAGTAAGAIFLIAASALSFTRRHARLAL